MEKVLAFIMAGGLLAAIVSFIAIFFVGDVTRHRIKFILEIFSILLVLTWLAMMFFLIVSVGK